MSEQVGGQQREAHGPFSAHAADGKLEVHRSTLARHGRRIQELVERGQEVLVQAVKDPMKTKGARLTTEISLPGRFVVFVPRSAPGDVGVVDIAMRGSFARAPFLELIPPAPSRVEPACPHYVVDRCGGCPWQHVAADARAAIAAAVADLTGTPEQLAATVTGRAFTPSSS